MSVDPAGLIARSHPEFARLFDWHAADGVLVLDTTLDFGADPVRTGWAVALLRECQSFGVPVSWHALRVAEFEINVLCHLFPPQSLDGAKQNTELLAWRANYQYGQYYFRQGPDFVQIKDVRDPAGGSRFALIEPELLNAFLHCRWPTQLMNLSTAERVAVDQLAAEQLVLCTEGVAVTVVPRMCRWPVPVSGV